MWSSAGEYDPELDPFVNRSFQLFNKSSSEPRTSTSTTTGRDPEEYMRILELLGTQKRWSSIVVRVPREAAGPGQRSEPCGHPTIGFASSSGEEDVGRRSGKRTFQ